MIGQTLLAAGAITPEQLDQALDEQRESGALLGDVLLSLKFISEADLARALAEEAGLDFVRLDGMIATPEALAVVPETFARKHLVAPVTLDDTALQVVQANPFDVVALDELQRLTAHAVEVYCAPRGEVEEFIERSYGGGSGTVGNLVKAGMTALDNPGADVVATNDAPIVKLIEHLLSASIARGATDLHVEPEEKLVRLRYRVDGVLLVSSDTVPKELHPSLVSRLKVLAGLDIAEQRLPQEGRISELVDGRRVDLRVSTFPTVFGEKVAIRILEKSKLVRGLEELGFNRKNHTLFRDVLSKSRGIILVTGPTGAGKTTTLYSALSFLASAERNILTVEDPVEYELQSIRQTQIKPKAGFTFATAIRSLLRQDPDVIMIGEIRDPETAQLALRAALSGVLVFSTLHTQDSAGAIPRLMDMGLEPYLLASGIVAVVAQRLIRVVCPECREPARYTQETLAKVGLTPDPGLVLQKGRGCQRCSATGYRGRTGAFEILTVDPSIHTLIRERADSRLIKDAAVKAGMRTLLEDALSKALFGTTTVEEVLRVAYE